MRHSRCSARSRPAPSASLPGGDDILKDTAPHPRQRSWFPGNDYIRFITLSGTDFAHESVVSARTFRVDLLEPVRAVIAGTPISSSPGKPPPLVSIYLYRLPRETSPVRRLAYAAPIGRRASRCPAPANIVAPGKAYRRLQEKVRQDHRLSREALSSSAGRIVVFGGSA